MAGRDQWKLDIEWCERKLAQLEEDLAQLQAQLHLGQLSAYDPLEIVGLKGQIAAYQAIIDDRENLLRREPDDLDMPLDFE